MERRFNETEETVFENPGRSSATTTWAVVLLDGMNFAQPPGRPCDALHDQQKILPVCTEASSFQNTQGT
jgi:hypothetical protein